MSSPKTPWFKPSIRKVFVSLPAEGSKAAGTSAKAVEWVGKKLGAKRSADEKDGKNVNAVQPGEGSAHAPADHLNCEINRHFKIYMNPDQLEYFFVDRDSNGAIVSQTNNNRKFKLYVDEDDPEFRELKAIASRAPAKRQRHYAIIADNGPRFEFEPTSKEARQAHFEYVRFCSRTREDEASDDSG